MDVHSSDDARGVVGRIGLHGLRCVATQGDPPVGNQLSVDVTIQLDLTAVAESDAIKAKRRAFSQRRGSATQRIGVPTHTQHTTSGQLTADG